MQTVASADAYHTLTTTIAGPLVVQFTASWCSVCKRIAPSVGNPAGVANLWRLARAVVLTGLQLVCCQVEALVQRFRGSVPFAVVDTSDLEDVSVSVGVSKLPAFALYRDGQLVRTVSLAHSAACPPPA